MSNRLAHKKTDTPAYYNNPKMVQRLHEGNDPVKLAITHNFSQALHQVPDHQADSFLSMSANYLAEDRAHAPDNHQVWLDIQDNLLGKSRTIMGYVTSGTS